jgi:hypothetical protein
MSHMSAANTPAQGPAPTNAPPPLDLDGQLRAAARKQHPLANSSSDQESEDTVEAALHSDVSGWGKDHPLFKDLAPEDSYTVDGVYWVSLAVEAPKAHIAIANQSGRPAVQATTTMGQRPVQRRGQTRVQGRRQNVQKGPIVPPQRLLLAICHWRFRSLHRGIRVSRRI